MDAAALVLPVVGSAWREVRSGELYVVDAILAVYGDSSKPGMVRRRSFISFHAKHDLATPLACSLEEFRAAMEPANAHDLRPTHLAPSDPE